jgi:hypothetical protein
MEKPTGFWGTLFSDKPKFSKESGKAKSLKPQMMSLDYQMPFQYR